LTVASTIRVWHPRGPAKTEVWAWCIVDKAAPPEVKELARLDNLQGFSPGGALEVDDAENWGQCTSTSAAPMTRRFPFNYQLDLHREEYDQDLGGWASHRTPSENNQRHLLGQWAKLMDGKTWPEIGRSTQEEPH
jgi:3-phenylpropionate/trans-cinnamate dioxygenase alpha subunit